MIKIQCKWTTILFKTTERSLVNWKKSWKSTSTSRFNRTVLTKKILIRKLFWIIFFERKNLFCELLFLPHTILTAQFHQHCIRFNHDVNNGQYLGYLNQSPEGFMKWCNTSQNGDTKEYILFSWKKKSLTFRQFTVCLFPRPICCLIFFPYSLKLCHQVILLSFLYMSKIYYKYLE